jgi:ubiquinone/menaquinone biosynthesis C-methylase UbiE
MDSVKQKLDFGCGQKKLFGYIGLDIFKGDDIDVVHDFNCFPYPFEDNVFDEIVCNSSLEHVDHFFKTVLELHRISKPNALIKIFCPHYSSADAYRDPTHKTFFSYTTFNTFAEGGSYISPYHGMFEIEKRTFGLPENTGFIKNLFKKIFNSIPDLYEYRLCWIFPTQTIYYELRVLKQTSC